MIERLIIIDWEQFKWSHSVVRININHIHIDCCFQSTDLQRGDCANCADRKLTFDFFVKMTKGHQKYAKLY